MSLKHNDSNDKKGRIKGVSKMNSDTHKNDDRSHDKKEDKEESKIPSEKGGKYKMTILDKIIGSFVALSVLFVVFIIWALYISNSEIDIDNLLNYKPEEGTIVYDRDGELIAEIAKERRIFVSIDNVPEHLKQAFIAAEDRTFYTNPGIDLIGLTRAMFQNLTILLKGNKERYIGASTIAQQVVRNLVLTNERTIMRKIREMAIAYKISSKLSKDRILEIYLNHIYLGSRSYGIATAAKTYFKKDLQDLFLDECALLASLPKAPSILDPNKNPDRAINRRNWVLGRMLSEGFISQEEFYEASDQEIVVYNKTEDVFGWAFVEYIKRTLEKDGLTLDSIGKNGYRVQTTMNRKWQLIAQEELDKNLIIFSKRQGYAGPIARINIVNGWENQLKKVGLDKVMGSLEKAVVLKVLIDDNNDGYVKLGLVDGSEGSLDIKTMLWAQKQPINQDSGKYNNIPLTKVLKDGDVIAVKRIPDDSNSSYSMEQIPTVNGGVIIMSIKTGDILSMVGSYADEPASFNRAVQAYRQAGSTVKPFVYLSALENGSSPIDIFMDAELSFNMGDGEIWTPKNASNTYKGPVTLRAGLEESLNTVTIRVATHVGLGKVIKTIKKFNLMHNYPHNLSLVLGSGETTLLDLVRSYATIANYGANVTPKAISKFSLADGTEVPLKDISSLDGDTIEDPDEGRSSWVSMSNSRESRNEKVERIISPQVSYQLISMLKGASSKRSIASRTKKIRDIVPFGGKTGTSQNGRDLWFIGITPEIAVGTFVGYDSPKDSIYEYGSTGALPVFAGIMDRIKDDLKKNDFYAPSDVRLIKIDRKTGNASDLSLDSETIYEIFKAGDSLPKERSVFLKEEDGEVDGIY